MQSTRSKGLIRILSFFGLALLCSIGLHYGITFGLKRITTSKFGALNRVMAGKVDADIVINGSSRALNHFNSLKLQQATGYSTFNLGMNASQIDVQVAILKSYLAHNRKPKLVIQNLDLFSFETTKQGQVYDLALFVPYLSDKSIYSTLTSIDPGIAKSRYIPLYGYTVEDMRFTWLPGVLGCLGIYGAEDYFQGFNPRHGEWTEDFAKFRINNPNGISYPVEDRGIAAFDELLKTCKENGIRLLLCYSPEFYEMQAMENNRGEIMRIFKNFCEKNAVPLWDFSDSPISHNRAYFNNSQHLNAKGADAFSDELAGQLISSGLLQK